MMNKPIEVAVIGVGHRAAMYASYALAHPERMKVVAVADPDANRRSQFSQAHNLPQSVQFENYQQLAAQPRLADAIINGRKEGRFLGLDESVLIMEVMDEVRKQGGLVYPEKIETLDYPTQL